MAKIRIQTDPGRVRWAAKGRARVGCPAFGVIALLGWLWCGPAGGPLAASQVFIGEHAVLPGDQVRVPIWFTNAPGLASAAVTLRFDPALVEPLGVSAPDAPPAFAVASSVQGTRWQIAAARETGLMQSSGILAVAIFRARPGTVAGLSAPLTVADYRLRGQHGRPLPDAPIAGLPQGWITLVDPQTDRDANGLPDWWEERFFGGPTGTDPAADPDGDGMANWHEYVAGTDPLESASALRVRLGRPTEETVLLQIDSVPGKTYQCEQSLDLEHWSPVGPPLRAGGVVLELNLPVPPAAQSFYRVRLVP